MAPRTARPRRRPQRRADLTRQRVIDAAIEAFGEDGFERTSTRALVERAGTNLVAIHYHFGSKEAVYWAAAQHIADTIGTRSRAVHERVQRLLETPGVNRERLVRAACALYDDFLATALGDATPASWRRFLVREQLNPTHTGAFEVMFASVYPYFEAMFHLVGRLIGRPATHPDVRLLTTMIFGHVYVFRTNRTGALRILGWKRFGTGELRRISRVARKYIAKLLDSP